MDPERWRQVEALYHAALARPAEERGAFLADACSDDELRREVTSLIAQSGAGLQTGQAAFAAARLAGDPAGAALVGRRLGPYEVQALLGAGGMGEVYRARDTRLGREVAIKVLPAAFTSDPGRLARFEREARVLAALNHPHIGALYGLEPVDGGLALVLELVEGDTLADRLARSGRLRQPDALGLARQIADALDAAHERGIIHRDLKPANIKITPDGVVKVLDFGLAKVALGDAADLSSLPTEMTVTAAGMLMGTAPYMSPEQARGKAVDKRTDVWSFGCVLYEMLSGQRPFTGETTTDVLACVVEREPDWSRLPTATPPGIVRLIKHCLAKDPKRRLRDIGDAEFELDDSAAIEAATPVAAHAKLRALAVVAIAVTAIAAGGAIWLATLGRKPMPASASLGARLSRVTMDSAFNTEPAISRDGALVVFASDRAGDGQLDLWLQRIDGGQPIRLTDDPADDREPAFAPDGRLIAFRSDRRGGGVYVMPALGGDARLVADRGRSPRFSPDGSRIAYWTGPWLGGPRSPGSHVFVVPAMGGAATELAPDFITARTPIWSPDGRHLLFFGVKSSVGGAPGAPDWWRVSPDGGEPVPTGFSRLLATRQLDGVQVNNTVTPSPDALPFEWTPDGVVFSARLGQSINLWRVKLTASTGAVVDDSLERLTDGAGSDLLASSDSTGRVAFQVSTSDNVYLTLPLDPNAGRPLGAIQVQARDPEAQGRNSVDDAGKLMAYPRQRGSESEIWVKDLGTGQDRHVATTTSSTLNPVISHDGASIAYTLREGNVDVGYVVPTAGGMARKICSGCNMQGWLADDKRILALPGIVALPSTIKAYDVVDGRAENVLVGTSSFIGRLDPSPDGRWIAFGTAQHIWMAPLRPGAPPARSEWVSVLETTDTAERTCGWSPDGRLLYVLLQRDGFRDLWATRIDPAVGKPIGDFFVVQHLHDPRRQWGSTPFGTGIVGNAFVFDQFESTGSIWLMDRRTVR